MKKTLIIVVSLVLILAGVGCVALSQQVTPADVDSRAVNYVDNSDIADANEFAGYANLYKALKLSDYLDQAHQLTQFELSKLLEHDNLVYSQLKDTVANNVTIGQQREELIFGETGILSLGLSMVGAGSLTGFIGLMRKRPGDWTQEEVNDALDELGVEVSDKDRQIAEIVKGVSAVMKSDDVTTDVLKQIKSILSQYQSQDTKETVAAVKVKEGI